MQYAFHLFLGCREDDKGRQIRVPHLGKKTPGCELIYARINGEGAWVSSTRDKAHVTHVRTELTDEEVNGILLTFQLTHTGDRRSAIRTGVSPAVLQQWSVEENGVAVPVVKCRRNANVFASHVDRLGYVHPFCPKESRKAVQATSAAEPRDIFHVYYSTEDGTLRPGASREKAERVLIAFARGRELLWQAASGNSFRLYGAPGVDPATDADAELLQRTFGLNPGDLAPADTLTMSPRALWRLAFTLDRKPHVSCAKSGKLAIAVGLEEFAALVPPTAHIITLFSHESRVAQT